MLVCVRACTCVCFYKVVRGASAPKSHHLTKIFHSWFSQGISWCDIIKLSSVRESNHIQGLESTLQSGAWSVLLGVFIRLG